MEVSCQIYAPAAITPGKRVPGTHWMGGLVDSRAGLDAMEKSKNVLLLPESNLGRPDRRPDEVSLNIMAPSVVV
jgi:hypothetical protein